MKKQPINFSLANSNLVDKRILSLTRVYKKRFDVNKINFKKYVHDKKILIAGSGPGREVLFMNSLNPLSIEAIDLSSKNIQIAKKLVNKYIKNKKSIKFRSQNIEKLPYKSNSFDHVFSYGVIHHASNTDQCFSELSRVLKKNGTMFIFLYGSSGIYFYLIRKIRKIVEKLTPKEILKFSNEIKDIDSMLTYHFLDDWKSDFLRTYTHKDLLKRAKNLGLYPEKKLSRGVLYDVIERKNKFDHDKKIMGEGELRYIFRKISNKQYLSKAKLSNNKIGSKDLYSKELINIYEPKFKYIDKIYKKLDKKELFTFGYQLHKQILKSMRATRTFSHRPILKILDNFIKSYDN